MELTDEQNKALKIAVKRYKDGEHYVCIAGPAGSGKTHTVNYIIDALGIDKWNVAYAAPTGRAAQVLSRYTGENATTLHKLLYKPKKNKSGKWNFTLKEDLDISRKGIIVVDEISMVDEKIWNDLLSFHRYIIALGDKEQLPPISGENEIIKHPHVVLTKVMRQAQDNDIIRLSMDIRTGKRLRPQKTKDVHIITRKDIVTGMYDWADVIACATNATRREINAFVRQRLYGEKVPLYPIVGDKIVCLKNNWQLMNASGDALVNGTSGIVTNVTLDRFSDIYGRMMLLSFKPDYGYNYRDVLSDYNLFTTGKPTVNDFNYQSFTYVDFPNRKKLLAPNEFDFAYALTTHKLQGGQYPKVMVIEECSPFKKEEHRKWLYSSCTRAIEKLLIVLNE